MKGNAMEITRLTGPQMDLAEQAMSELTRGGHLLETRSDVGDWFNIRTSSGVAIPKASISALCEVGAIEPGIDGLFGDSQTYVLTGKCRDLQEFKNSTFGKGFVCASLTTKTGQKARAAGLPTCTKTQLDAVERIHRIGSKHLQFAS